MDIADTILDTIGNTPLVRLHRVKGTVGAEILAKIEYFSPSGSVKDRILRRIVEEAERSGQLKPGMILIEATTGNAGISTAMIAAVKGYEVVICMPSGMSEERKKTIRAYGATIIETPGGESDVDLVMKKVHDVMAKAPGRYWEVGQFTNSNNWQAHYRTTGPELWRQTEGKVDAFIAPQGTGGTVTGVAKYFREQKAHTKIYAIEPAECPLLTRSQWGSHKIEGIGDGFIPETLDVSLLDGVVTTTSKEAIAMAQRLAREEGIFCGISSGCSVAGALKLARRHPEFRRIVTVIWDNGLRYFSTELCGEQKQLDSPERDHPMDARTQALLEKYRRRWEVIA
jgi:cysteine synthase A